MRVLIDECAPRALKNFLLKHGHQNRAVQEAGWSGKENGELVALAESEFDVLVTLDTNLRLPTKLGGAQNRHRGPLCPLKPSDPSQPYFPACLQALEAIKPGEIVHVETAT
jgi:hypothetical protein